MKEKQPEIKVELLALGKARGFTTRRAADAAGIPETTARRLIADPTFQPRVNRLREDIISQAVGKLSSLGGRAATALGKLLNDPDKQVVLKAAQTILANLVAVREHAEISSRLDALEQRGTTNAQPRKFR